MRILAVLSLAGLLPLWAQQHGRLDDPAQQKNPLASDPAAAEAGQKLFVNGCAACHGADGKGGRGPSIIERLGSGEIDDAQLYQTIQKGVPGGAMPASNLPEKQGWQLVSYLRSLTAPAALSHVAGNPSAGETLFWGEAKCSGCHAIRGRGGRLGPDLTNIGADRTATQLRDALLDPNANPVPGYLSATVTLKDGTTLRGVARNRTNYSIDLQDGKGNLHLLSMSQVRDVTLSKISPMPSDYSRRMSKEQIQDILAYLSAQSIRPVESANNSK